MKYTLGDIIPPEVSIDFIKIDYDFFQSRGYQIFIPQALATGQAALPYDRFTQALEYPFQAFNFFAQKHHG